MAEKSEPEDEEDEEEEEPAPEVCAALGHVRHVYLCCKFCVFVLREIVVANLFLLTCLLDTLNRISFVPCFL